MFCFGGFGGGYGHPMIMGGQPMMMMMGGGSGDIQLVPSDNGLEIIGDRGFEGGYGHPMMMGGQPMMMMMGGHPLMGGGSGDIQLVLSDNGLEIIGDRLRRATEEMERGGSAKEKSATKPSRQRRLQEGREVRVYHQTDPASADRILQSQRMRRGSSGLAGGGIYFAESPSETERKTRSKGVILSALVKLGNEKRLGPSGDHGASFSSLQDEGYDSVIVDRPGGTEYVVYNWDQVSNVTAK